MDLNAQMLSQVSRMAAMMKRIGVAPEGVASKDGGLAWMEARTKCLFCRTADVCRGQLDRKEFSLKPKAFCPNAELFYSGVSQILRQKGLRATD